MQITATIAMLVSGIFLLGCSPYDSEIMNRPYVLGWGNHRNVLGWADGAKTQTSDAFSPYLPILRKSSCATSRSDIKCTIYFQKYGDREDGRLELDVYKMSALNLQISANEIAKSVVYPKL